MQLFFDKNYKLSCAIFLAKKKCTTSYAIFLAKITNSYIFSFGTKLQTLEWHTTSQVLIYLRNYWVMVTIFKTSLYFYRSLYFDRIFIWFPSSYYSMWNLSKYSIENNNS